MSDRPQFFDNNLKVAEVDEASLRQSLDDLRNAVLKGVNIIEAGDPATGEYDGRGIFTGELGVAVAYLRLAQQATALSEQEKDLPDFQSLANARTLEAGPDIPLRIGGLSPLPSKSPIAAVALRMLHQSTNGIKASGFEIDIAYLNDAINLAFSHGPTAHYHGHDLGADEVLFGRAGLLWTLLNIRTRLPDFGPTQQQHLQTVLRRIPDLASTILEAGRQGAAEHVGNHGEDDAFPLMWPWLPGHHGIGWAHGLTGIIPILLACRPEELTTGSHNHLNEIGGTVTALCKICIAHGGHLPTAIPPKGSSLKREQPLVQICHGAPALLGLLSVVLKNTDLVLNHWTPEWDTAICLATDRVWEEGLLSKGGGLCHGIAGNAWPLLMLHDAIEDNDQAINQARAKHSASGTECPSADELLGKALAMLLHARETKPYNTSGSGPYDYRLPDHPFSLFEGLAGTVCTWAEACVVILAKLRKMEVGDGFVLDKVFQGYEKQILGFPCLGGNGAMGVL
ncbi:lanthionine synthetase C family protein [Aspergillus stella-maris]|uniref:lanthionine synthetase C family protein n=1 Tax=Aspergillus stella-maris TaxID=1810926 RepID=UPI003CCE08E4